jgi:phosphoribosylglycinamide formyltransferase-1
VLAGFMRLLTPGFIEAWHDRLVNIHPALLPSFRGLDTHRRALKRGVKVHGCTVHFVRVEMDTGPIIAQAVVPVEADDTPESLGARVLAAEHKLYPSALRLIAEGCVTVEQDRAVVRARQEDGALFSPPLGLA